MELHTPFRRAGPNPSQVDGDSSFSCSLLVLLMFLPAHRIKESKKETVDEYTSENFRSISGLSGVGIHPYHEYVCNKEASHYKHDHHHEFGHEWQRNGLNRHVLCDNEGHHDLKKNQEKISFQQN